MIFKLLTEHHMEFLSLTGCCRGWSESKLVKMPHCWKSHATAHIFTQPLHDMCLLAILVIEMGLPVLVSHSYFNSLKGMALTYACVVYLTGKMQTFL